MPISRFETAMILAAGRGKRMQALGERLAKGLLKVNDRTLLDHQLEKLARLGIKRVVLNLHHLAEQIQNVFKDRYHGMEMLYSIEPELLGTGGGILNALPLLGDKPFVLLSADIWQDYPLEQLWLPLDSQAHLIMVENSPLAPAGDFSLKEGYLLVTQEGRRLTYGGLGVLHPSLFQSVKKTIFPLIDLLRQASLRSQLTGEYYAGKLFNTNTTEDWIRLCNTLDCRGTE